MVEEYESKKIRDLLYASTNMAVIASYVNNLKSVYSIYDFWDFVRENTGEGLNLFFLKQTMWFAIL